MTVLWVSEVMTECVYDAEKFTAWVEFIGGSYKVCLLSFALDDIHMIIFRTFDEKVHQFT